MPGIYKLEISLDKHSPRNTSALPMPHKILICKKVNNFIYKFANITQIIEIYHIGNSFYRINPKYINMLFNLMDADSDSESYSDTDTESMNSSSSSNDIIIF